MRRTGQTRPSPFSHASATALLAWGFVAATAACTAPVEDAGTAAGEPLTIRLLKEPLDVPAFSVTDLDGQSHSTADWRGKVVLVNFWATWCAPCRAEIPDLIALQDKYKDRLVVVGLSEDDTGVDVVRRFAVEHQMNYTIAMSTPELRKLFPEVMALPTTYVLDPEGRLVQKNVGMLNAKETEASMRHLAGLATNVQIVRVDLKEKAVGVENVAQVTSIPGVDLSALTPDARSKALVALNESECTCGCNLTVARCRIDDPSCPVSLPLAKSIVETIAAAR
jgi:thiol-disulfide isomerase/thioredoxin